MNRKFKNISVIADTIAEESMGLARGLDIDLLYPLRQAARGSLISDYEKYIKPFQLAASIDPLLEEIDRFGRLPTELSPSTAEIAAMQIQESAAEQLVNAFADEMADRSRILAATESVIDPVKTGLLTHFETDGLSELRHLQVDLLADRFGPQLDHLVPDWLAAEVRRTDILQGLASGDWMNLDRSAVNHAASALANMQGNLDALGMASSTAWYALDLARRNIDSWLFSHDDDDADEMIDDEAETSVLDDLASEMTASIEMALTSAPELLPRLLGLPGKLAAIAKRIRPWSKESQSSGNPWTDASHHLVLIMSHYPNHAPVLTILFQRASDAHDQIISAPAGATRSGHEDLSENEMTATLNILLELEMIVDEIELLP